MSRWWCVVVVVVAVWCGGVRGCGSGSQSRRQPSPARPTQAPTPISSACRGVDMLGGTATPVQSSVLSSLCQKTLDLTRLKTSMSATSSQAASPNVRPRPTPRGEQQAAMMLIHRDDFSNQVRWESGGAMDVTNAPGWQVDNEVQLTNGYNWYSHGVPAWPLLHQTTLGKKKKMDWPNYAIATPMYLAGHEASNSRDINIAVRKLFAGDFRPQQTAVGTVTATNAQGNFADAAKFKGTVERIVADSFLDQNGAVRRDLVEAVRDPATWLRPLVLQSLPEMLDSFAARQSQAPKGGSATVCPDELYVYFRQEPCPTVANCQIVQDVTQVLRVAGCINTKLVVGYSLPAAVGRGPA